jgi:hypothetical protein
MNIAQQVARYEEKGFTRDQAQVNVLMEHTAITIFRDFPDAFLLFGGATLVLFYDCVRHSTDLDLLPRTSLLPSHAAIVTSLDHDLQPIAEALRLGALQFQIDASNSTEARIFVTSGSGQRLFRVDLTLFGPAIESEIEEHHVEDRSKSLPVIKSATKDLLLLQKAETFLLRRAVKARDAYDVHFLAGIGAKLSETLRAHLSDALLSNEIEAELIRDRIDRVNSTLCRQELRLILPAAIYIPLEEAGFRPLRDALEALYAEWL